MDPESFKQLEDRRKQGTLREIRFFKDQTDFFSNDYLGISRQLAGISLTQSGSTGSRLISGNSEEAVQTENFLSGFFESEAALLFNSGYTANVGLFSCIASRNDTIIYDELIHASVRDGIRLSAARSFSFRHNDLNDLQKKTGQATGNVFIAVESLYSMDGDFAPLEVLSEFCSRKGYFLLVDEAHSGGVFGNEGRGLVHDLKLPDSVFARIITFGKAYGSHGAVVLGSEKLKHYLINFARSFIYTTALAPHQCELIRHSIELSKADDSRRKLHGNISTFRTLLSDRIHLSDEESPIQLLAGGNQDETKRLADYLLSNGFAVKAILAPTVPKGQERIRLCLHAYNTRQEIESFAQCVRSFPNS